MSRTISSLIATFHQTSNSNPTSIDRAVLSLRLHDVLDANGSLEDVMRDISRKAQERGLTPDILESILRDE